MAEVKRAVVIKTAGDPDIAGAIVEGMTRSSWVNSRERAELSRLMAQINVRRFRRDRDWWLVQAELAKRYSIRRKSAIGEYALIAWAFGSLFVVTCAKRFWAFLKGVTGC